MSLLHLRLFFFSFFPFQASHLPTTTTMHTYTYSARRPLHLKKNLEPHRPVAVRHCGREPEAATLRVELCVVFAQDGLPEDEPI